MKRVIVSLFLCFAGTVTNAQLTTLFQATPKVGTLTTFNSVSAANVTASTPTFSYFTTATNPCTFSPSRSFTDTNTIYKNQFASNGNQLEFSIYPSSTSYKLTIENIKLKISSNVANVKYRVGFVYSNLSDQFAPYSQEFTMPTVNCDANITTNTTEQICLYPKDLMGTTIVDNVNRLKINIVFYNAPSSADIRVSGIAVNGCVLANSATTDCLGNAIKECLYVGRPVPYSNYNLLFADEFDTNSYDTENWVPRTYGGFGGIMTSKNIVQTNGTLQLRYTYDTVPSSTIAGKMDTAFYGAGISTTHNFKYGYFEIRAKLYNGGKGFHQSFWQVGSSPTSAMTAAELATPVNAMQNQIFEFDSDAGSTTLQPSIWTVKNATAGVLDRNQGAASNGFGYQVHIKDIATSTDFFTSGVEITPDSLRYYFNGKLRFSYPFVYPYNRDIVAMASQLSGLPVPQGYYNTAVPLPQPNAAMVVDYFRYYAPKSGVGINFLSNFSFGDAWYVTSGLINKPNSWINPATRDIFGNLLSFNQSAANQDSITFVPDAPNIYDVALNTWSMRHQSSSANRTATRQILEYIPNGNYEYRVYVKCSNKVGDSVLVRVKTRNSTNTSDTLYQISANNSTGLADANWRKIILSNIPVVNNTATLEFYSKAAANSYTYFDSAVFIGISDTIITVSKKGCVGTSVLLVAPPDIPVLSSPSTTYRWQVSTYANGVYNPWNNVSTDPTGATSTNGYGASYAGVTNDSLVISNIGLGLLKARYRCVITTAATSTTSEFVRYSGVFQFDTIYNALNINVTTNSPSYLGSTVLLNAVVSGGSGNYSTYLWSGPNNFSDSSKQSFIPNMAIGKNGIYSLSVTDSVGCFSSNSITINVTTTATNPFIVKATTNSNIIAYSNLQLNTTITGRSGTFTFTWIGPNNFSSTLQNPLKSGVLTRDSGRYVVLVKENSDGYIASDTLMVSIAKRPQTISFTNIGNLNSYTSNTVASLIATSSSGLPVSFTSSNTALASFVSSNSVGFGRTLNAYSIIPTVPITASKFRIYSTQTSHYHIREFRLYAPNVNGYPSDPYADGGEASIAGLTNLALSATVTASGQYALGATYMPQNANDSLVSTSWVSQQNGVLPAEKWIQFDFPSAVTVGNIQFVNGYFSGGVWNAPVTLWKAQYWNGTVWVDVTDCKVKITAVQNGDDNNLPATAEQWLCVNTSARTVTNVTSLPVDILAFTVTESNKIATLKWSVANEVNVSKYVVERSTNVMQWQVIGAINATKASDYQYRNGLANDTATTFYYRLKIVDVDGSYKYSEVRKITVGINNNSYQLKIYPNPVLHQLQVFINDTQISGATLCVYNVYGKKVMQKTLYSSTNQIDVGLLAAGYYLLTIDTKNNHYFKHFIKQ